MSDCTNCEDIVRRPSISLEEWRKSMNINPAFYFWQMGQDANFENTGTPIPINTGAPCESLVFDVGAFGGAVAVVGRDEIYDTILRIDERIRDYLGYWPRPTYSCDEMHFKRGYGGGTLRLKNAKLRALGQETWTLLATQDVDPDNDIDDDDNDGLLDTVTVITPVVEGVAISELSLFFTQDVWCKHDRFRNEIRPINVEQVDDNWIITFPAWVFAKPTLYAGMKREALDPNVTSIYAISVDIYRRWTDPAAAITVMRQNINCFCENTGDCYTCSLADGCIVDAERGVIEIKPGSGYCQFCARRIIVHYLSGDQIDSDVLARLYAGYLGRDVCCGTPTPTLSYWQADYVGMDSRGKVTTSLTMLERSNPFGTTRGAIDAYRFFRQRRARKAVRL